MEPRGNKSRRFPSAYFRGWSSSDTLPWPRSGAFRRLQQLPKRGKPKYGYICHIVHGKTENCETSSVCANHARAQKNANACPHPDFHQRSFIHIEWRQNLQKESACGEVRRLNRYRGQNQTKGKGVCVKVVRRFLESICDEPQWCFPLSWIWWCTLAATISGHKHLVIIEVTGYMLEVAQLLSVQQ